MTLKILYVMGFARSGSTLLDTVLSDAPEVFGAGELTNLVHAMDIDLNYCSCGEPSGLCPLWSAVRREWARAEGDEVAREYSELQPRIEHLRHFPRHRQRRGFAPELINKYLSQSRALFEAIAKSSGAAAIVDSSKAPVRALALSRMEGVDFRAIHLIRDVRGVACSLGKSYKQDRAGGIATAQRGMKPSVTARKWLLVNAVTNRVRVLLGDRAQLVRYEDLVSQPLATLKRLSRFAGIDLMSTALKLDAGGEFNPGHAIEGNRLRMQRRIRLKPDMRWRVELPKLQKALLPLVTAPVAWSYGYRPFGRERD